MNTVNTEFSSVEVWFTDQVSKALEIEDNVNLTLIIGQTLQKNEIFKRNKFKKHVIGHGFLSFARKFGDKYGKK